MDRNGRSPSTFNNGKAKSFKAGPFRAPKSDCASSVILFGSADGLRDTLLTFICDNRSSSDSNTSSDLDFACTS